MSAWRPIIAEVSARHGMHPKDVMCGWKSDRAVAARYEIFWRLNQSGVGLAEIGRRLGGYDHTTVRHGVRKWAGLVANGGGDDGHR